MLYLCCEMQKWMCLYSCPNLVHCLILIFFVCVSVAYQHTAAFFSSKITIYVPAVAAALKAILLMFFYSISPPLKVPPDWSCVICLHSAGGSWFTHICTPWHRLLCSDATWKLLIFSLNAPPFSFDPKISQSFKNAPSQPHYFMRIGLKCFRGKGV